MRLSYVDGWYPRHVFDKFKKPLKLGRIPLLYIAGTHKKRGSS
jgi:hypothetical protein